jgi:hypothetical protein
MQGGGVTRSLSYRTWHPAEFDAWTSTATSFAFSAFVSLSGASVSTLADQLTLFTPPPHALETDDRRYSTYWQSVQELSDRSYYCSRDGIVFISGQSCKCR